MTRTSARNVSIPVAVGLAAVVLAHPAHALRFLASNAASCARAETRLDAFEQAAVQACGRASGCTAQQERLHTRLARVFDRRCVALNQLQVLGTHNSYHVQPREPFFSALLALTTAFNAWEYTHLPLGQQFDEQGIRQIELDVFADPAGGLYAARLGPGVAGIDLGPPPGALFLPGMKVLHVQDLDFETTCLTFIDCLTAVRTWSDAHPHHLPIMILVEVKDDTIPGGFTVPVPFGKEQFDALDAEIRSVFSRRQIITPDAIRGGIATLDQAVHAHGWPTLA